LGIRLLARRHLSSRSSGWIFHTAEERGDCSVEFVLKKEELYSSVLTHCRGLLEGETDLVAAMSTIVCELHHGLDHFYWTGFYRVVSPGWLKVGPYQGTHGCLAIPFDRGVCGKCAREARVQLVRDVRQLPYHIACSASTLSEIVVPVFDRRMRVQAVLDVDSNDPDAFDEVDARNLQEICGWLARFYPD
jgi:GAF domain-containing protein